MNKLKQVVFTVIIAMISISAVFAQGDGLAENIEGTAWELLVIRDFDALMEADMENRAVIEFNDDGTFHMSTGCGQLGGIYTLDGENITFEVQMTTLAADCGDDLVAQALIIEEFLPSVTGYNIDEGEGTLTLSIDDDHDATFNQLQKIDDGGLVATDVIGVTWLWQRFDDTAEINHIEVDDPSRYTLTLNADGTYEVKADCNQAGGNYTLDASSLTFETGPSNIGRM